MPRVPVRLIFVLLVCATAAAFFITQRLKRTEAVVSRVRAVPKRFSPNGDGRRDVTRIAFLLRRADDVTATVVNARGAEVRTLAIDHHYDKGQAAYFWNGNSDTGRRAPDGTYYLRVGLRRKGISATTPKKIFLDARPPRPLVASVSPSVLVPGSAGRSTARVSFRGPNLRPPEFLVYRTGLRRARLVARFQGAAGGRHARWDGRVADGRPAPPGNYLVAVRVHDAAGNIGSGPPRLPPRRSEVEGHPGLVVRYLAASAPKRSVVGGGSVRLDVTSAAHRYRWSLQRVGSRRPVQRGEGTGRSLRLPLPHTRPGVYLIELRARGRAYRTPLVLRGSPDRRRPLVVLSATTWQATNPVDSNDDGFADVLGPQRAVPRQRAYAQGGLPIGFGQVEAPLLDWLDRQGLDYDVTTDLDLMTGHGPRLAGRPAVFFPGSQLYLTPRLAQRLVAYVRRGGRVASLGVEAFRRTILVSPTTLRSSNRPARRDVFGERLVPVRADPPPTAAMVVSADRAGLFSDAGLAGGSPFGNFGTAEELVAAAPDAHVLETALLGGLAAGRRPAFSVYRLGLGFLLRSGSREWNANLVADRQVGRIMREAWDRLSR